MEDRRFNFSQFLIVLAIVGMLTLIVMAALALNHLWDLIGGVIVLGLISVGLAAIGVKLFSLYASAQNDRDKQRHHHAEQMAEKHILVTGYGFPAYEIITAQAALPDPDSEKRKQLAQVNFSSNDPITLAVNLVLYSLIENGPSSNRICGMPIAGCSGRAWTIANGHLQAQYGVVSTRGAGGGTYVSEEIGNLKNLYQRMTINALPGVTR